ncbi:hypothetical protein C8F01DRAFT_1360516 [Mycena amicta]|nr:hypothetical protein C8F01DRAFT_1360516 [Mycena amicta]
MHADTQRQTTSEGTTGKRPASLPPRPVAASTPVAATCKGIFLHAVATHHRPIATKAGLDSWIFSSERLAVQDGSGRWAAASQLAHIASTSASTNHHLSPPSIRPSFSPATARRQPPYTSQTSREHRLSVSKPDIERQGIPPTEIRDGIELCWCNWSAALSSHARGQARPEDLVVAKTTVVPQRDRVLFRQNLLAVSIRSSSNEGYDGSVITQTRGQAQLELVSQERMRSSEPSAGTGSNNAMGWDALCGREQPVDR